MSAITLSAQPIKTTVGRGDGDRIYVTCSRVVPEHPDPERNILASVQMFRTGDPFQLLPGRATPETPFTRLLYRCRAVRQLNREAIAGALLVIETAGFYAIENV